MGKGDRKTKRGKISTGTFGVRRSRKRSLTGAVIARPPKPPKAEAVAKPKAAAATRKKSAKK